MLPTWVGFFGVFFTLASNNEDENQEENEDEANQGNDDQEPPLLVEGRHFLSWKHKIWRRVTINHIKYFIKKAELCKILTWYRRRWGTGRPIAIIIDCNYSEVIGDPFSEHVQIKCVGRHFFGNIFNKNIPQAFVCVDKMSKSTCKRAACWPDYVKWDKSGTFGSPEGLASITYRVMGARPWSPLVQCSVRAAPCREIKGSPGGPGAPEKIKTGNEKHHIQKPPTWHKRERKKSASPAFLPSPGPVVMLASISGP